MFETRIYFSFENRKQLNKILKFTSDYFNGFTLYKTIGFWKGIKEKSRIIEILSKFKIEYVKYAIANYIKEIANQESVLITSKTLNMEFI